MSIAVCTLFGAHVLKNIEIDMIVMDCHATARGSIPGGNGVFTEPQSFARDREWGCRI